MTRLSFLQFSSVLLLSVAGACGGDSDRDDADNPAGLGAKALENRAYIVSQRSDELTVIDLDKLEIIRRIATGGQENHMAELNADFTKIFVDSSASDEAIVIDASTFEVEKRLKIPGHPTHLTLSPDGSKLAIMAEETNQVVLLDPETQEEIARLGGFATPHFMRFSKDGNFGYVANISGASITRVDMRELAVMDQIGLSGFEATRTVEEEGGFADAQIDDEGVLYAAHRMTGRVLTYDTRANRKIGELEVGQQPWVAFAEHPYTGISLHHVVPNFGDKTISVIDAKESAKPTISATLPGDEEAYGVNFSPLEPNLAFVMNRVREDIAVVDTEKGEIVERIDVGGNTETASTSADGKLVVATVSSANKVVVIDVATRTIKKTFDNVGSYPWSVTIPKGQNYCH